MLEAFMERMEQPASAVTDGPRLPPEEAESFEAFFRAEHARLLRALFVVTGSAEEAEELMQEAFLSVWERWERVRSLESPTGYLYRTAMNAFRSRLRRAARIAGRVIRPAPMADPFEGSDERDAVARALAALTERQRAALVLTEMLGFGSEEAGEILGVKAVTVRVLASQGRAAMRGVLGDE
jgi:RNA polymerase sigma factor (sigma-70 family)